MSNLCATTYTYTPTTRGLMALEAFEIREELLEQMEIFRRVAREQEVRRERIEKLWKELDKLTG